MNISSYDKLREPSQDLPHRLTSQFLKAVYDWRADLRQNYDLQTRSGALTFLFWWLEWGFLNYGVNLDVGLTPEAEKMLFEFIRIEDTTLGEVPRLFEFLYELKPEVNALFPRESDNSLSKDFIEWGVKWGFPSLNLTALTRHSSAYKQLRQPSSRIPTITWIQHVQLLKAGRSTAEILKMSENDIQVASQEAANQTIWATAPPSVTTEWSDEIGTQRAINIFGVPSLSIGIGEDARLLSEALTMAAWEVTAVDRNHIHKLVKRKINLFAVPAPDVMMTLAQLPFEFIDNSYNIASCPWELPHWPKSLMFIFELFDEVWIHSRFVLDSIPVHFHGKVRHIPLPVTIGQPSGQTRKSFGLPEASFLFFTAFDFSSTTTRKNPLASLAAFKLAFPDRSDVALVIKTNSASKRPEDRRKFMELLDDKRFIVIEDSLTKEQLHDLYRACDCFVSLHRSEGFGRNIAESMLMRKPVIVTNYSGNLDFSSSTTALMVPYKLIPLQSNDYIFSEGQSWADADVEHAAEMMKIVVEKPQEVAALAENGFKLIASKYSLQAASEHLGRLLAEIWTKYG